MKPELSGFRIVRGPCVCIYGQFDASKVGLSEMQDPKQTFKTRISIRSFLVSRVARSFGRSCNGLPRVLRLGLRAKLQKLVKVGFSFTMRCDLLDCLLESLWSTGLGHINMLANAAGTLTRELPSMLPSCYREETLQYC